jgi:leucyl/phenylalanyl-tRNA--protein transferase
MSEPQFPLTFDLSPRGLLYAYSVGFFPMANTYDAFIDWYSPDQRAVIPLEAFKVSRSTRQVIKKNIFDIRLNTAFTQVMKGCGDRDETWITKPLIEAYTELHHLGFAHSVEAWHGGRLVGGLYGVALGGAFFGESMFHTVDNASKVATVALVERLKAKGFVLLDSQFINANVARYGAIEISRTTYPQQLKEALKLPCKFV